MKKQPMIIVALGAVLIIGVIIVFAMSGKDSTKTDSSASTTTNSATPSATPAPKDAIATDTVAIKDYAFAPKDVTVKVGTTVTWTNQDSVRHSVTADQESADAPKSPLFAKGETYSFTFKKAGVYSYHCEPHPYMKGTVTVTE